jgi:hypothetical protein
MILEGDDLRRFQGPLVYEFWKGKKVLYVGLSCTGIARPFNPGHDKKSLRLLADRIIIHWCLTEAEARTMERILIETYRPQGNEDHESMRVKRLG